LKQDTKVKSVIWIPLEASKERYIPKALYQKLKNTPTLL